MPSYDFQCLKNKKVSEVMTMALPTCPWSSGGCPTFNIMQCCSVPLCRHHYRSSLLGVAVLGAVSCCNSDTWASELAHCSPRLTPSTSPSSTPCSILAPGKTNYSLRKAIINFLLTYISKDHFHFLQEGGAVLSSGCL